MADQHTATALAITAATGLYLALMPKLADVRRSAMHDEIAADMRTGAFVGGGVIVALGAVAAYMSGDYKPLVCSLIAVAVLTAGYEFALRTDGVCL